MHYYIITGTSRGIGEALAYALIDPQNRLFCISRSDNPELRAEASAADCQLSYYQQDLAQSYDSMHLMGVMLNEISLEEAESINLIQNAAVLDPVSPIGKDGHDDEALVRNVNVNITTPMLMTNKFVQQLQGVSIPKRILNISSGAGRKARHAWGAYCSTKAAMDMHSQCLALEQQYEAHPIKVVALAPGVVDTAMQEILRSQEEENFREVERFRKLKENGQLWSPDFVANASLKLLHAKHFGTNVILDLRDFVSS